VDRFVAAALQLLMSRFSGNSRAAAVYVGMLLASSLVLAATQAAVSASTAEDRIVETLGQQEGFLWGAATAAYQIEGAWNLSGRQPSIWDNFCQGNVHKNENGKVADDFYDRYEADIQRVADYGFNSFRFSIAWPRIFPKGADGVHRANPEGVQFYKNVISSLLAKNITPLVTMFHWDLPDDLDWLDASVVTAFAEYAEFLFQTFPEVKHWITMNEPWSFCFLGYGLGIHAPGVKSNHSHYTCGHFVLLAHAQAVDIYRKQYQKASDGKISIVLNTDFGFPRDPTSIQDVQAAQLYHDFHIGWFADPIYLSGDYPPSMRERLGDVLPRFTKEQSAMVKGSFDFYGLNTYAGKYITANKSLLEGWQECDGLDGKPIGPTADSDWLLVVPRALRAYLEYVNKRYSPGAIIITENGVDVPGEDQMPLAEALDDTYRVDYFRTYIEQVALAVKLSAAPVTGYFAWSLLDNFEWADGYSKRFGITYVSYTTQERTPKASAKWFTGLFRKLASAKVAKTTLVSSGSEVYHSDTASLQCLRPEVAGCGWLRDKAACLSSLDGREGYKSHGLKVGGEPCVWCGGTACTDFSNASCAPYDWLINGQGVAYNHLFLAVGIFDVARCPDAPAPATATATAPAVIATGPNITHGQAPAVLTDEPVPEPNSVPVANELVPEPSSVLVPQPSSVVVPEPNLKSGSQTWSPGGQIALGAGVGLLLVAGVVFLSSWRPRKESRGFKYSSDASSSSDCSTSETDAA